MIKDEYKRLLALLEEGKNNPKNVKLEDILKEAVVFFEELRSSFPKAGKEDREEMMEMMTHLHAKLQEISEVTTKETGLSEEELAAYAENPSNFTPEQWQLVQETRGKLYNSARKFSGAMQKEKEALTPEGEESPEGEKPAKKPIRNRTRRSRRKDWTKS